MKKLLFPLMMIMFCSVAFAQNDLVNDIFRKYAGIEGVTTVNITGDMLNMFTQAQKELHDSAFASKLSEVRILALDKDCDKPVALDLRSEVYDKLDKSLYKEMMSVKQNGEDVVILVKELNGRISEILLIAGGTDENALIQVKGDMLMSEITQMAGKYQMKGFEHLKDLEKE